MTETSPVNWEGCYHTFLPGERKKYTHVEETWGLDSIDSDRPAARGGEGQRARGRGDQGWQAGSRQAAERGRGSVCRQDPIGRGELHAYAGAEGGPSVPADGSFASSLCRSVGDGRAVSEFTADSPAGADLVVGHRRRGTGIVPGKSGNERQANTVHVRQAHEGDAARGESMGLALLI